MVQAYFVVLLISLRVSLSLSTDEIQSLPGLKQNISFKQYSGYLSGGEDNYLHYWFVESQSNPSEDPVILWLNGGPGCSSVDGLLTENGPFRVASDGQTVTLDPNSWNTLANVLYLESPVGVGYSYYGKNETFENNDETTAQMNHFALEDFFKKFPQFSKNPFYITGESYAGVYIPMLAVQIFRQNSTINLKGVAIGNGLLDYNYLTNSAVELSLGHGIISSNTMKLLNDNCCQCKNDSRGMECFYYKSDTCNPPNQVWTELANIFFVNPYNVLDDCPMLALYERNHKMLQTRFNLEYELPRTFTQINCPKPGQTKWLNLPDVRKALHIPDHLHKWSMCGGASYKTQKRTMRDEITELVEKFQLDKIVIYNGDLDMMCDFLGDQRFVDSLGYNVSDKYKPWKVNGRIGGFLQSYSGVKRNQITFTTVRGAGHMVPTDQPEAALAIIKDLIGIQELK